MTDSAPMGPPPGWWSPPPAPQPGVVPLRPLAAGDVLSASLRTLRRSLRSLVVPALLAQLVVFVVYLGVFAVVALIVIPQIVNASPTHRASVAAGTGIAGFAVVLLAVAVSIAVQAVLQSLIAVGVSRQILGERPRLAEIRGRARGRIRAVVGWAFLFGAAAVVAFGIVFGVGVALFGLGHGVGAAIGSFIVFLGGIGLEVVFVWIGVRCGLVASILMLERLTIRQAIARSWRLTRGRFWPTLGALLLTGLVVYVATLAVSLPFSVTAQLSLPFGQLGSSTSSAVPTFDLSEFLPHLVPLIVLVGIGQLLTVVVGAAGLVLVSSAVTIVYVDLRSRHERLDLDLLRYVESREAGDQDPADPYLRR